MGPGFHSPQLSLSQVSAQTKEVLLAFGGNRPQLLQGLRLRGTPPPPTWSQLTSPATYHRQFLTTLESPDLPLFIVHTSFSFFFSSISLPLTCSSSWWQGPSVWGHLRSGLGSATPCSHIMYGAGQRSSGAWSAPPTYQTCVPNWW